MDEVCKQALSEMLDLAVPQLQMTRNENLYLVAEGNTVYLTDGTKRHYYCHCRDEVTVNGVVHKIHVNKGMTLANAFVEIYTREALIEKEQAYQANLIERERMFNEEQEKMQRIFAEEIKPLFSQKFLDDIQRLGGSFNSLELVVHWGPLKPLIRLRCNFNSPHSPHIDVYRNIVEIFFCDHKLTEFSVFINDEDRFTRLSLDEVKDECKKVITNVEQAIQKYSEMYEVAEKEQQKQRLLLEFVVNALNSKDCVTLFRNGSSYIAIHNWFRYSVSSGKRGRFYRATIKFLLEMITKKGYTEYYKSFLDENSMCTLPCESNELKKLGFNKIDFI